MRLSDLPKQIYVNEWPNKAECDGAIVLDSFRESKAILVYGGWGNLSNLDWYLATQNGFIATRLFSGSTDWALQFNPDGSIVKHNSDWSVKDFTRVKP